MLNEYYKKINYLVNKFFIFRRIYFLISTYSLIILKKTKLNDSYVQIIFTFTETTEGLQIPQRIFVV